MEVSEPQDGNMLKFGDGFVGGCGFFELLFSGCYCCGCSQINADKE